MRRGPGVSKRPTCDGTGEAPRDWAGGGVPRPIFDIATCPASLCVSRLSHVRGLLGGKVMGLDGDLQAIR